MASLILASKSPQRIELLGQLVASYGLATSAVEDTGSDLLPEWELPPLELPQDFEVPHDWHPTLWAWRKAVDVALGLRDDKADAIVLGADTIVVREGTLLGKPKDDEDAIRMLQGLRDERHFVVTGYALVQRRGGEVETLHAGAIVSAVWMRDYSDFELEGYVATGEPLDKAGAYAVQGLGGKLVSRVEVCYQNVVGLPLCEVRRALVGSGVGVLGWPEGGYCEHCSVAS